LHPSSEAWIPVPTAENTYVVNIGDVLSTWTGGQYRSALHRVINRGDVDRYSIPFFFDGTMTTRMQALDGSGRDEAARTVGEHFQERFSTAAVKV
jgi:isopenicillin N synthase-like dioxygenase